MMVANRELRHWQAAHHDNEGVGDAGDGFDQRHDHLVERLDTLEESEDAKGTHHLEVAERAAGRDDASHEQHAHRHDDEIEVVPARRPELFVRPTAAPRVEHQFEDCGVRWGRAAVRKEWRTEGGEKERRK